MNTLDHRGAALILADLPFSADDVTDSGNVTLDPDHEPNAAQNGIGSWFNAHARAGHIAFTGEVVRSTAPHRKGGAIRVWQGTAAGRRWAEQVLA